jgi:thiol:disulfide interchange protein DsbA
MRNRNFINFFIGWLLLFGASGACSEGFQYEEGTHYAALNIPVKTRDPNVVEVTEYFSYACPHCYQFEPLINQWRSELAADVVFNRTPAIFNGQYEFFAQVYYTAEALNVLEVVHGPLFQAIHGERRRLFDPTAMALFFSEYGVDPVEFARIFSSFGVRASRQQAEARGRAYRSRGVPAMIINGKYRIEGDMAGNNAGMLAIASFLVERERRLLQEGAAESP